MVETTDTFTEHKLDRVQTVAFCCALLSSIYNFTMLCYFALANLSSNTRIQSHAKVITFAPRFWKDSHYLNNKKYELLLSKDSTLSWEIASQYILVLV